MVATLNGTTCTACTVPALNLGHEGLLLTEEAVAAIVASTRATQSSQLGAPKSDKHKTEYGASKGSYSDCISSAWIMAYIVRRQFYFLTPSRIRGNPAQDDDNELSEFEKKAQQLAAAKTKSKFGALQKEAPLKSLSGPKSKGGDNAKRRFSYR